MQTILVQPGENALQSAIDSLPRELSLIHI